MADAPAPPLTPMQWLICGLAAIGFCFDIYVILVMPPILRDVVTELTGHKPGSSGFELWKNLLLFLPLVLGGLFGLIGGWLTDVIGRRGVLTWSILLYAAAATGSAFAANAPMLLVFRCLALIGVCVEFVAAVAWVAELFPDPKQREKALGWTQAFGSFGGLLTALMLGVIAQAAPNLPPIFGKHEVWRYLLLSGVFPAIPLMLIRPFVPESPVWARKKLEGTLRRPSFKELFAPALKRTTIVSTLLFACAYGAAFGAIQQMPQFVDKIADAPKLEAEKLIGKSEAEAAALKRRFSSGVVAKAQTFQEVGGLLGRCALAALALAIVGKGWLLRLFQLPGLVILPFVFWTWGTNNYQMFCWGIAAVGFCTTAQFSFWGNYLPVAYPTHLRGTGGIFAANVGGRILGTAMFLVTSLLALRMPGSPPVQTAHAAAIVGGGVFLVGLILSFFLPEPKSEQFQE